MAIFSSYVSLPEGNSPAMMGRFNQRQMGPIPSGYLTVRHGTWPIYR